MKRALPIGFLLAPVLIGQWNQFRGPNGSGSGAGSGYPVEFSPTKNLVWKRAAPFGQSSPVIASGRLYFTASEGDQLLTVCLDDRTGRELWRRSVQRERKAEIFRANDPASPTPAADELGVYSFFADFGIVAYDRDGKERWRAPLGPFKNFYGMAASPIVAGEMVVMVCDQVAGSYALALDRKTGRTKWKADRPGMTIGWATPMVFRPQDGPAQLIVLGSSRLDSYDLETGTRRWWMPVGSAGSTGVPVAAGDLLLFSTFGSTDPWMPTFESALERLDTSKDGRLSRPEFEKDPEIGEHFGWLDTNEDGQITAKEWNDARDMTTGEFGAAALRPAGKKGELSTRDVLWRLKKNLPYVPAPLLHEGVFYLVKSGGIVTSLDPVSGRRLKEGRAPGAPGEYFASPVAADGKLYLTSEEGRITVLKAGGEWEVLATNDLGEEVRATPALAGGRVYVRTRGSVLCFAAAR